MANYPEAASESNRGTITYADQGEGVADIIAVSRKDGDGNYEWVPLNLSDATVLLWMEQGVNEASNPQNVTSPLDPYVSFGALNLAKFTEGRMRATITDSVGTSGVEGTLQYSADNGNSWATFLTPTLDFSDETQTTDWAAIAPAAVGSDIFVSLRLRVAGTGSAATKVTLLLDLRG